MGGLTAFPQAGNYPQGHAVSKTSNWMERDWKEIAIGSTFLAGALLLLSGKKKAGLAVTGGAMALTLLDQKDTLEEWWGALPKYLDDAQRLLDRAESTIEDLASKREKLRSMFNR